MPKSEQKANRQGLSTDSQTQEVQSNLERLVHIDTWQNPSSEDVKAWQKVSQYLENITTDSAQTDLSPADILSFVIVESSNNPTIRRITQKTTSHTLMNIGVLRTKLSKGKSSNTEALNRLTQYEVQLRHKTHNIDLTDFFDKYNNNQLNEEEKIELQTGVNRAMREATQLMNSRDTIPIVEINSPLLNGRSTKKIAPSIAIAKMKLKQYTTPSSYKKEQLQERINQQRIEKNPQKSRTQTQAAIAKYMMIEVEKHKSLSSLQESTQDNPVDKNFKWRASFANKSKNAGIKGGRN